MTPFRKHDIGQLFTGADVRDRSDDVYLFNMLNNQSINHFFLFTVPNISIAIWMAKNEPRNTAPPSENPYE